MQFFPTFLAFLLVFQFGSGQFFLENILDVRTKVEHSQKILKQHLQSTFATHENESRTVFNYMNCGQFQGDFSTMSGMVNEIHLKLCHLIFQRDNECMLSINDIRKYLLSLNVTSGCISDLTFYAESLETWVLAAKNLTLCYTVTKCTKTDITFYIEELEKNSFVVKHLDAMGKISPGLLEGNLWWLGNYQECTNIDIPVAGRRNYKGKLCHVLLPLSTVASLQFPLNDKSSVNFMLKPHGANGTGTESSTDGIREPATAGMPGRSENQTIKLLVFRCFVFVVGLLVTVATCFEYFIFEATLKKYELERQTNSNPDYTDSNYGHRDTWRKEFYDESGILIKSILAFSLYKNAHFILGSEKHPNQIHCIHGIRVISMAWIIWGHSYLTLMYSDNPLEALKIPKYFFNQVLINATFAVDTFFLLSGLLLSFLWFKHTKRNNGIQIKSVKSWVIYFVHRYLRLTPVYGVIILVAVALMPYWAEIGPFAMQHGSTVERGCPESWWINLLYLNNIVFDMKKSCFGHTWYLANDMQFHVFAPFLLIPLWFFPNVGIALAMFLIVSSMVANAVTVFAFHMPAIEIVGAPADPLETSPENIWRYMYNAPWIRFPPYVIGMLVGYIMANRPTLSIPKWVNMLAWLTSVGVCSAVLFGLYDYVQGHQWPLGGRALYSCLCRPLWSIGVAWVIYACHSGHGGQINTLLSWGVWFPLSRLTYVAYLIHVVLIPVILANSDIPPHWRNHLNWYLNHSIGLLVFSYFISFFISTAFELPPAHLEKVFLRSLRDEKENHQNQRNNEMADEERVVLCDEDQLQKSFETDTDT